MENIQKEMKMTKSTALLEVLEWALLLQLEVFLANKDINVYCLISDGECAEGSVWEALRFIKERKLTNLHIYVNANGWAAYDKVDLDYLEKRLKSFLPRINFIKTSVEWYGLSGQSAHYANFSPEQYEKALKEL